LGEETFAGMSRKEGDAPIADIRCAQHPDWTLRGQ
jgi:hypothetical protein